MTASSPALKRPHLQGDAFLADVRAVRQRPVVGDGSDPLEVWWLGQSGFLVGWAGRFLLLDPYLSDSLTRKYAATDKPHVRLTERVVDPAGLDFVEVVTTSHNHTDHLDPETLRPLVAANPGLIMVCPAANRAMVRERSGLADDRILGLDPAGAGGVPAGAAVAGFRFHAIPAAHEALDRDGEGRHLYVGWVLEAGPFRIYHSGDTVRFDGMAEILRPHQVDLALLPINGRAPERRVAGNLGGREAAELAHDIGAGLAVPCHYDLFAFNTASPEEFTRACVELRQGHRVLEQGERLQLPAVRAGAGAPTRPSP